MADFKMCLCQAILSIEDDTENPEESVFCQVQSLFGHLMESKLQYYVPENFWKVKILYGHNMTKNIIVLRMAYGFIVKMLNVSVQIFKMWNKELYVREQQDAYEFFTSLVDQLDEHLKVINQLSGSLFVNW